MSKRKYNKKSDYWNKFPKNASQGLESNDVEPITTGSPYHVSEASYSRNNAATSSRTSSRINRSSVTSTLNKFSQIRGGLLPYEISSDGINVRDAIELCQKAYAKCSYF